MENLENRGHLIFCRGGGERCRNAQKHFIIKTHLKLILYKPVGKYQFAMACIRALVMIAYEVINCLISKPNICFGYSKEPSQ